MATGKVIAVLSGGDVSFSYVCVPNLNSDAVVIKPTAYRVRSNDSGPLNRAIDWRIFFQ